MLNKTFLMNVLFVVVALATWELLLKDAVNSLAAQIGLKK